MKKWLVITMVSGALLAGCKEPAEVEVFSSSGEAGELEVAVVSAADTDYVAGQIDSTAVLPGDQIRFAARVVLNKITHDGGQTIRTQTFSRVVFENRLRPVRVLGRVFGYHGINLGPVLLDGLPMTRIPHIVPVRHDSLEIAGFEYFMDAGTYQPHHEYTWSVISPDSVNPFSVSSTSPGELAVQSPGGGSIVRRNNDLPLHWTGAGRLSIVISGFDPATLKVKPFLVLKPRTNTGSALLSRKMLRLLPNRFQFYVFTFVLANRDETTVVGRFPGRVLVQTASVYNTYVELR